MRACVCASMYACVHTYIWFEVVWSLREGHAGYRLLNIDVHVCVWVRAGGD